MSTVSGDLAGFSLHRSLLGDTPSDIHAERHPMGPYSVPDAKPKKIYRYIVGITQGRPEEMTTEEIDKELGDPFAQAVLKTQMAAENALDFPQRTSEVMRAFEESKTHPKGMRRFSVFLVAEGVAEKVEEVANGARNIFVVKTKKGIGTDALVSSAVADDGASFLELASWDPLNRAFNFYQRIGSSWVYSGNSFHAHDPRAHGKGPFSGHPTGGIIMKELRSPWPHWFSSKSSIMSSIFRPGGPIPQNSLFERVKNADQLELFIKAGNNAWNEGKVARLMNDPDANFRDYFCQLLETCNVNLTSSPDESKSITAEKEVRLPATFFVNHFAFAFTGLNPNVGPAVIPGSIYLESLRVFDVHLVTRNRTISGETHFAFLVPEVAEEDIDYLGNLIRNGLISSRLAASLLMVDFSNPIYSSKRASLLKYIPTKISYGNGGKSLEEKFIRDLVASGSHQDDDTPEYEFFSFWKLTEGDWRTAFTKMIDDYMSKVRERCRTAEGSQDIIKLAVSRRRLFRKTPQLEFNLTLPRTNISDDSPILEMDKTGRVLPA